MHEHSSIIRVTHEVFSPVGTRPMVTGVVERAATAVHVIDMILILVDGYRFKRGEQRTLDFAAHSGGDTVQRKMRSHKV